MAYLPTEHSSNIQASFPHQSQHSLSLEDDGASQQSGRLESAPQHPQGKEAHRSEAAMQQTEQLLVHVQCWGTGLTGISLSCPGLAIPIHLLVF